MPSGGKLLFVCLYLLLVSAFCQQPNCPIFSSCTVCTLNSCSWCAFSQQCVFGSDACPKTSLEILSLRKNLTMSFCNTGKPRAERFQECSILTITVPSPFSYPYQVTNGRTVNISPISVSLAANTTSLQNLTLEEPVVYVASNFTSYSAEPIAAYAYADGFKTLTVIAERGIYKLGFAAIAISWNATTNSTEYHCGYAQSAELTVRAAYEQLYSPGLYAGVIFFFVMLFITFLQTLCCKFEERPSSLGRSLFMESQERTNYFSKLPPQLRCLDQLLSIIYAPNDKIIQNAGTSIIIFLRFQRVLVVSSLIIAGSSCAIFIPLYATSNRFKLYDDIAQYSVSTLSPTDIVRLVVFQGYNILLFLSVIPIMLALYWISRTVISLNKTRVDNRVVMISNIPRELTDEAYFVKYFKDTFGEKLLRSYLAYSSKTIQFKTNIMPKNIEGSASTNNLITAASVAPSLKPTGHGFAIFATTADAKECIKYFKSLKKENADQMLKQKQWRVKLSYSPNDIIWNNLQFDKKTRRIRTLISTLVVIACCIIGFLGTSIAQLFQSLANLAMDQLYGSLYETNRVSQGFAVTALSLYFDLFSFIIAIGNLLVAPVIKAATSFEKHNFISNFRRQVLKRHIIYVYLNTFVFIRLGRLIVQRVSSSISLIEGAMEISFYNDMTIQSISYIVSQTFTGRAFSLLILNIQMVISYIRKRKVIRPKFDFESAYSIRLYMLILIFNYASRLPLVGAAVALYFTVSYFTDRWLLLHLYSHDRDGDARFLGSVLLLFAIMMILTPIFIIALTVATQTRAADFLFTLAIYPDLLTLSIISMLVVYITSKCIIRRKMQRFFSVLTVRKDMSTVKSSTTVPQELKENLLDKIQQTERDQKLSAEDKNLIDFFKIHCRDEKNT